MAVRIGNRVYQGTDVYYAGREPDETARERENRNRAESERRMRENAARRTAQTQADTDRAEAYTKRDTDRAQAQVDRDTARAGAPTGTESQRNEIATRQRDRQAGLRDRREQIESGLSSTRERIQGRGDLGSSATNQFIQYRAQRPRTVPDNVIADSYRTARTMLGERETDRQLAAALPRASNLEPIGNKILPEEPDYELASLDETEDDFLDVDGTDLNDEGFPIGPRPDELELQEDRPFSSDFSIA